MNSSKILKNTLAIFLLVLILASCSANRNSLKGCDGHKKTKVPFGYM